MLNLNDGNLHENSFEIEEDDDDDYIDLKLFKNSIIFSRKEKNTKI